ncbi:glycosyltransferase family 4 protein [Flavobacterium sp. RSSB_23]|uniref:glycosyltransferase family 4 protein n=1 Tax=Flavobacterium sp. RSSB_23 TaxID=3447668 RepID=UPI003F31F342
MSIKTILATCYTVNPYRGSKEKMGWNFIVQIARYQKVIAITRKKNQAPIEKYLKENKNPVFNNITFLYFDLPYWMRFWKKEGRGGLLYYYMWQRGIVPFVKSQTLCFDIVHNVNFNTDWMPSFLWKLNKPMVWGPVGSNSRIPKQYLKLYSKKHHLINELNWIVKNLIWKHSKSFQKTIDNSTHIWCMNRNVPNNLGLKEENYSIHPPVASEDFFSAKKEKSDQFNVLSVGRFVALKGFDLTINAFIGFVRSLPRVEQKYCKLTLIGTGPEKELYQKIIDQNDANDCIEILEWMDQQSLMQKYQDATVFLFPSHEGAGMVIAEALSFGLPIICLDNDGPGQYITEAMGIAVPEQSYTDTVIGLKQALLKLYKIPHLTKIMSDRAREHYEEKFSWESRGTHLKNIYNKIAQ